MPFPAPLLFRLLQISPQASPHSATCTQVDFVCSAQLQLCQISLAARFSPSLSQHSTPVAELKIIPINSLLLGARIRIPPSAQWRPCCPAARSPCYPGLENENPSARWRPVISLILPGPAPVPVIRACPRLLSPSHHRPRRSLLLWRSSPPEGWAQYLLYF
jgi:hypothetical protein